MLSIPSITITGMNNDSFCNFLKYIHSGNFHTNTRIIGIKQAVKIESRFHGCGQICTAEVEKKLINAVDKQKDKNAAVPHISQFKFLIILISFTFELLNNGLLFRINDTHDILK